MIKPILSLIVLIISIGFAIFYVKPEYDHVQDMRADLKKLSGIIEDTNKIKTLIKQTGEILNAIDVDNQTRLNVFLPETLDPIRFANNLQSLGLKNGIVLSEIEVEEKKPDATTQSTPKPTAEDVSAGTAGKIFSISQQSTTQAGAQPQRYVTTKANFIFSATYGGLLSFLKDLEKSLGLINITSLSFKPLHSADDEKVVKEDSAILYQFTAEIEVYSLK